MAWLDDLRHCSLDQLDFYLKNFHFKISLNQIVDTIFSSSSFLSIWPRDHLAWPIGFVSLSKAEISFVKVLLRSNSDKSSWVKFNSYEQQQQPNPKLLGPLCGKLQYISESKGPPSPISFDLNPLEGDIKQKSFGTVWDKKILQPKMQTCDKESPAKRIYICLKANLSVN